DQAVDLQLQEDLHQEPRRDAVRLGDGPDLQELRVLVVAGQLQHGDAGVLGFGGYTHGWSKSEIRSTKSETNSNKAEQSKSETASPIVWVLAFSVLLGFVSDFVLRISNLVQIPLPPSCPTMCSPHSFLSVPAQRPARSSSPSSTGRVQGQQPM